jgi:hypothetical protein
VLLPLLGNSGISAAEQRVSGLLPSTAKSQLNRGAGAEWGQAQTAPVIPILCLVSSGCFGMFQGRLCVQEEIDQWRRQTPLA